MLPFLSVCTPGWGAFSSGGAGLYALAPLPVFSVVISRTNWRWKCQGLSGGIHGWPSWVLWPPDLERVLRMFDIGAVLISSSVLGLRCGYSRANHGQTAPWSMALSTQFFSQGQAIVTFSWAPMCIPDNTVITQLPCKALEWPFPSRQFCSWCVPIPWLCSMTRVHFVSSSCLPLGALCLGTVLLHLIHAETCAQVIRVPFPSLSTFVLGHQESLPSAFLYTPVSVCLSCLFCFILNTFLFSSHCLPTLGTGKEFSTWLRLER